MGSSRPPPADIVLVKCWIHWHEFPYGLSSRWQCGQPSL